MEPETVKLITSHKTMNMEALNNWSQAFFLVALIFGIMAMIYIVLYLINQKKDRKW